MYAIINEKVELNGVKKMKDIKAIITRAMLAFIAFIIIIIVYAFVDTSEDKGKIRLEEERIAEYTVQNFKDVKKIEFKSFEKNSSTQTWFISAVINDNIHVSYSLFKIGENANIGIAYNPDELKNKTKEERDLKVKDNIEVIYK